MQQQQMAEQGRNQREVMSEQGKNQREEASLQQKTIQPIMNEASKSIVDSRRE
jgi:hypothetical protein